MTAQKFRTVVAARARGGLAIPVPFDPDAVWSKKPKHHVRGSVGGLGVRGVLERDGEGFALHMGPAWARDCGVEAGSRVEVVLEPEGPQRANLAPDVRAALDASPQAGAFFDSLAQFYRKAYLRWIDATKRSPEERARRIAELVELLKAGKKQRD